MDTVIVPQMTVETEEDLSRFLDLANLEMRHLLARMEERSEHSVRVHAQIDATLDRIEERLRHVQANR